MDGDDFFQAKEMEASEFTVLDSGKKTTSIQKVFKR